MGSVVLGRFDGRVVRCVAFALVCGLAVALAGMVSLPVGPAEAATTAAAGEYVPVSPVRIVNTLTGVGGRATPLDAGTTASFQVLGAGGVPLTGVSAVSMTVSAVSPTAASYLTVFAQGETRPWVSQLSLNAGVTVATTVISKVGASGQVSFYNYLGSTGLVVDMQGYYTNNQTTGAGGTFVALTPQRIVYTGSGLGGSSTPLGAAETRLVQVLGQGGVPGAGVAAVVVSVAAVGPTLSTYFAVWGGGTRPGTSVLNVSAGQSAAALVQTSVDATGKISVYNASGTVDLVVDVEGYYLTPDQDAQGYFVPVTPTRVFSTVSGINSTVVPMTSGSTASVPIRGVTSGSSVVVPNDKGVSAVVLSVAAANVNATGYMSVFPEGVARTGTSVLNYNPGGSLNVTGTVIAKVGGDGRVSVFALGGTPGLVVDVQGYFQSTPPPAPPAPTVASTVFPVGGWAASVVEERLM